MKQKLMAVELKRCIFDPILAKPKCVFLFLIFICLHFFFKIYCLFNAFWIYQDGFKSAPFQFYSHLFLNFFEWHTLYFGSCSYGIMYMAFSTWWELKSSSLVVTFSIQSWSLFATWRLCFQVAPPQTSSADLHNTLSYDWWILFHQVIQNTEIHWAAALNKVAQVA